MAYTGVGCCNPPLKLLNNNNIFIIKSFPDKICQKLIFSPLPHQKKSSGYATDIIV